MASPAIDYDALAKQFGGSDVDYDALAKRFGGADIPAPKQPAPQPPMAPVGAPPIAPPVLPAELQSKPAPTALDQPPQQFRPPAQPAQSIGPLPQVTGPTNYTPPGARPPNEPGTPVGGLNQPQNVQPGLTTPGIPKPPLPAGLQGPPQQPNDNLSAGAPQQGSFTSADVQTAREAVSRYGIPRLSPPGTPMLPPAGQAAAGEQFSETDPAFLDAQSHFVSEVGKKALDAAIDLASPESLATMLAAGVGTGALKAAANAPKFVEWLSTMAGPNRAKILKAVDMAASGAVPATFGGIATHQAVQAVQQGDPASAIINALIAGGAAVATHGAVRAAGELHPPPPVEATGTRAYQGAPAAPTPEAQAQAPAMTGALEQSGQNLAAQSWRDIANHGRSDLPYDIDAGGRRLTIQPDPAKPTEFVKLVDPATGTTLTAGRPAAVRSWIDMNIVRTRPNPQGGGAISVGAGAAEAAPVPQQAVLGQPAAPIGQVFDQQNATYQRAVEIAQATPSFGRRLLSTKLGIKQTEVDPIIARLVDDKIVNRAQNKTGGVVYSPIPQPPPAGSAESKAPEQPQVPATAGQVAPAPPPANTVPQTQDNGTGRAHPVGDIAEAFERSEAHAARGEAAQQVADAGDKLKDQFLDADILLGGKESVPIQVGDHSFTIEKQPVQTKTGLQHDYVVKNGDGDVVAGLRKPAVDAWLAQNIAPPAMSETPKVTESANNAQPGVAKPPESVGSVTEPTLEQHPPTFDEFAAHPTARKFASTQVNLPDQFAAQVRDAAAGIPDSELAEDGREVQPHVTVKWGLHDNDPVAVQQALVGEGPITAKVGKVSMFPASETGSGADVVKLDVDSPDLHRLNEKVSALPHTDTNPAYKPHITLAYVKAGEGQKYVGKEVPGLTGQTITFGNVTHSGQNHVKTEIPLGNNQGEPNGNVPESARTVTSVQEPSASTEREQPEIKAPPSVEKPVAAVENQPTRVPGVENQLERTTPRTGTPEKKPALEASVNDFPELAHYRNKKTAGALKVASLEPSDKHYGQALRLSYVGERNVRTAETNQVRDKLKKLIPDPVDQEALSLYRDFKNRHGELEQFRLGTHPDLKKLSDDERSAAERMIAKLNRVIDRALHPTDAMLAADKEMTGNFEKKLTEGRRLGFLDSKITNEEYVSHLLQPRDTAEPGEEPQRVPGMKREMGTAISRHFQFGNERYYPTLLHAVAAGLRPRTLNALDAMTIHGDKHATAAATKLLTNYLKQTDLGKWGFRGAEGIPADWVELAPQTHAFRNQIHFLNEEGEPSGGTQMLFVPPEIEQALKPITERSGMSGLYGFRAARAYQSWAKAVELGLSLFHMRALSITALNNMGPGGILDSLRGSMDSPAFQQQERDLVKAGGITPILGQTQEAYRGLQPTALPTRMDIVRGLPGIKQADAAARYLTRFTFDILQRKFKVTDFALKDAAWIAKNPHATQEEIDAARAAHAKEIDAAYGGLNWERMGVNKTTLDAARALMLAPDWTFSNVINAKYAFEGGPAGRASRLFWIKSAITGLAISAALSALFGLSRGGADGAKEAIGRWKKDPTNVYLGDDDGGKEIRQNLAFAGAPQDFINLLNNTSDFGAVMGPMHSIAGKLAPIPHTGASLLENRDWMGKTIVPKDVDNYQFVEGHDTPDWVPPTVTKSLIGAGWLAKNTFPLPFSASNALQMMLDPNREYTKKEYATTILGGTRPRHVEPIQ